MKLTPIGERVVLKPLKAEEKTKSGIFLPRSEDKKEGIVEAVGTLRGNRPMPLQKGDHVMYGGYSHEDIEIEGEKFLIVDYKDVVAKIMKDDAMKPMETMKQESMKTMDYETITPKDSRRQDTWREMGWEENKTTEGDLIRW